MINQNFMKKKGKNKYIAGIDPPFPEHLTGFLPLPDNVSKESGAEWAQHNPIHGLTSSGLNREFVPDELYDVSYLGEAREFLLNLGIKGTREILLPNGKLIQLEKLLADFCEEQDLKHYK